MGESVQTCSQRVVGASSRSAITRNCGEAVQMPARKVTGIWFGMRWKSFVVCLIAVLPCNKKACLDCRQVVSHSALKLASRQRGHWKVAPTKGIVGWLSRDFG